MDIVILIAEVLAAIFVFFFILYFLHMVRKNDGPLNLLLMALGSILLFGPIILLLNGVDIKILKDLYNITGITGGSLIFIGLKDMIAKENDLKTAGDWRKNLYKLEQKPYYTIDDLYELNSYINPYSKENKVSVIVNEVIVNILENHRGEGCVSYKNSDCNNCSDKNDCKDEISISYDNLRNKMIDFLKNNDLSKLELERTNMTAFDFEVNKTITKTETTKELDNKIKNKEDDGYLTPEENNLVRLACHVLLKAEWREWSK